MDATMSFSLKNRDNIDESEFVNPSINLDEHSDRGWRAFQLAFLLMTLKLSNFEETTSMQRRCWLIGFQLEVKQRLISVSAFTIVYNRHR